MFRSQMAAAIYNKLTNTKDANSAGTYVGAPEEPEGWALKNIPYLPIFLPFMKEKGMDDVLLTGGGIIPEDDMQELQQLGVGKLFAPGASTASIADYIRDWVNTHREF